MKRLAGLLASVCRWMRPLQTSESVVTHESIGLETFSFDDSKESTYFDVISSYEPDTSCTPAACATPFQYPAGTAGTHAAYSTYPYDVLYVIYVPSW